MNPIPKWFGNKLYKLFFDRPGLYLMLGTWLLKRWARAQARHDGDAVQVTEIVHEVTIDIDAWCVDNGFML